MSGLEAPWSSDRDLACANPFGRPEKYSGAGRAVKERCLPGEAAEAPLADLHDCPGETGARQIEA
jgi:hypothetical protein